MKKNKYIKAFSVEQYLFTKKNFERLVHNRGAIIDVRAEKHPTKSGFANVNAKIAMQAEEGEAMDILFFKRFHQHLTYAVKDGVVFFTIV